MKILFAHDHKFFRDSDNVFYSPGNFPYRVLERYLTVFDSITVVAREQRMDSHKRLLQSCGPNVKFVTVPSINSLTGRLNKYRSVKKTIERLLQNSDALIARLPSEIGLLAVHVAITHKKPWAVEVVGCVWDGFWTHGSLAAKAFAPFAYLKTKKVISASLYSLYVTEHYLQQRYPSAGKQTSCSNVEIFVPDKIVLQNKLSMLQKENKLFKLGLIGSLAIKTKGLKTAFKSISLLIKNNIHIKFEIVGDGDQEYWKKLVKKYKLNNHVVFKGTLKAGDEINNWLDSCHLYIQPSLTEGLPRALIEAMSRGCPAIGSDVGGIPELLETSFLHPAKKYKKLASLILSFIHNSELAINQSTRNFYFAQKYSKQVLDQRRTAFWNTYRTYINEQYETK